MKEHDIRPAHLLQRYLDLSARDAEFCFGDSARTAIPCVACGDEGAHHEFDKNGFAYACCDSCGTLFQCPRPSRVAFERFYRDSESSRYWANVFFLLSPKRAARKYFAHAWSVLPLSARRKGLP